MKGVADAAAGSPGHGFIDGRGRLLHVHLVIQQPVLSVSENPPTDHELLERTREALAIAAKRADQEMLDAAGFHSREDLAVFVEELLGRPSLAEVVTAVCDALKPEPGSGPEDPEVLKPRRLCKLMGTC